MRINRYVAQALCMSRPKAENLILAGRVELNGRRLGASDLSFRVAKEDQVCLDGRLLSLALDYAYLLLHKPPSYIVSHAIQGSRQRNIYSLLPAHAQRYYYAGRLDKESRGLVILSNDGDFIHKLSHPSYKIPKYYQVTVSHLIPKLPQKLRKGIWHEGEFLQAAEVRLLSAKTKVLDILLYAGRKRHIRRMLNYFGIAVIDLYRYRIGEISIEKIALKEGAYAQFSPENIGLLQ